MGNDIGFEKLKEVPSPIPKTIQNAFELQEKTKKIFEKIIRDYQDSYTAKNHIEQVILRNDDIYIGMMDYNSFAGSFNIKVPAKQAAVILTNELERLTVDVARYEKKLKILLEALEDLVVESND